MTVGIFGHGRLGTAAERLIGLDPGMELAWIADKGDPLPPRADVALDSSSPIAVADHVAWARSTGTNLVIGATGWDKSILNDFARNQDSLSIGILVAPNFSLGVAFMRRMAVAFGRFASLMDGADIGISERHHTAKLDAPSGTAKLLAEAVESGCPRYSGWTLCSAEPGKIPVSSLRCGSEIGWHEIRLEAGSETLCVTHEAKSRELFAEGALRCLRWIAGKKGLFSFDDMAAEIIDRAFSLPGQGD